jgi:transposase
MEETVTVYCGVDFHARMQTVAYCNTADGEVRVAELDHRKKDEVREFYAQFSEEVVVGLEASGYSTWFEAMLEEFGHTVWMGHATEVRRRANWRQKNDRRDAELLLELMLKGDFPKIHRPRKESVEVLRMLRYRHRLVKMRTMIANSLQGIAISVGMSKRQRMLSAKVQQQVQVQAAQMSEAFQHQVGEWINLLSQLNQQIQWTEDWLEKKAEGNPRVQLIKTHPGIGVLTGLALVHTLEPISRFSNQRKVVAYIGLEPMERSSADKKRFLGISKAGSRLVRFLLGEAGSSACKGDPELKRFYSHLVYRRGKPNAKVAVGRKLLIRSYIMLRDNIDYAEFRRRGVEARLARQLHRPDMPDRLIERPASCDHPDSKS